MFELKKIISSFFLLPGLFVTLLIFFGFWFFFKKNGKAALFNFLMGVLVWLVSTAPVSDAMLKGLESRAEIPRNPKGDVIILLGGGVYDGVPDFSGVGAPSGEMAERLIAAVRLQKKLRIPIIVSGGKVFEDKKAEAPIVKRFLLDLGVSSDKIITEEKSRDTFENVRYTKEICSQKGFRKPIVVTSAFHMRRAVTCFETAGMKVLPFPSGYKTWQGKKYGWEDYMPGAGNLSNASAALKEYAGFLFYKIVL